MMDVGLPGGVLWPPEVAGLGALTPAELAEDGEAARLVCALARMDGGEVEPVKVAAFNSFI